jgi:N-acetylglucosaminyl-diphospho-decaprenol L-rhamnosyltransferase
MSGMSHKLSIIIVSFNTKSLLQQCLDSIFDNKTVHELEVFVVDNDSADDSVEMVNKCFPQVRLIANKINMGFAAANNQAFNLSTGAYIVLLNPDSRLQPHALDNAVAFMEAHPTAGICGCRLLNFGGQLEPSARRFPNSIYKLLMISGISAKFASSKILGRGDYKYFDHNSSIEVDWVPGTFSLVRREMLDELGFFDERFYLYYEETDLCLRAKRVGWKVFFFPGAEVIHAGGACSKTRKDMQMDIGGSQLLKFRYRSELLYFRKNFGLMAVLDNWGVEMGFHLLRYLTRLRPGSANRQKRQYSLAILRHGLQAFRDTHWGTVNPPTPW